MSDHTNESSAPKRGAKRPGKGTTVSGSTDIENTKPTANQTAAISEITRMHDELRAATRRSLNMAIDLGERLVMLKKLKKAVWLLFVKRNLPFCAKTAERYMNVYRNRARLEKFDTLSNLTLSGAYELLATEKTKKTVADPDTSQNGGSEDAAGATNKSALLTAISRSLCDGLERLSPDRLKEFEADMLEFKRRWFEQHQVDEENEK